jgi:hypothetical protein
MAEFPAYLASVRKPVYLALATTSLLAISGATADAQALAPATLHLTSPEPETKYEPVQMITITKEPAQAITKEKTSGTKLPVAHYC